MSALSLNKITKSASNTHQSRTAKSNSFFVSRLQRFKQKIVYSPGPGSYEYKTGNFTIPEYHVSPPNDSAAREQHQWIWGSDRASYLQNMGSGRGLGPGSYSATMHEAVVGRTNWSKSDRFVEGSVIKKSIIVPGPGQYEIKDSSPKKFVSSVFKSKSPKTFIEQLHSESSVAEVKKTEVNQFITNPEVSLDKSQIKSDRSHSSHGKNSNSSVFASKIPRFEGSESKTPNLGPGSYGIAELKKQTSKQKLPKIAHIKHETKKKTKKPAPDQQPGPGAYQISQKTIEKSIQSKGNIVISTQARFVDKTPENPGPGHYMRNKKTYASEIQKLNKLKYSPEKPSFNSSSSRSQLELASKSNPLCAYNLGYFDMDRKVRRNLEHINKLKIMEVTLPAFNTKSKR